MFGKSRLKQLGLALLLGGACSGGQQKATGIDFDSAGLEGFDETHFDLLAADCTYSTTDPLTREMTLTMGADETAYLFKRGADGVVVANANKAGVECTVQPTKKITINGGTGDQKVILDFYAGLFGQSTATSGAMIVIALGAGTGDTVKIRGTPNADLVTFGTNGTTSTSYAAISVVGATPARTTPDISMTGVESVLVSTGAGNDVITGQGGAPLGGTAVGPLAGAISMTVYGGEGNDTITSGGLSPSGTVNSLNGGAGNDLFLQQAILAADTISGGADTDTVDYSARTAAVRVTLGVGISAAAATGSIACVAKTSIADNDSFTISDGTHTKTFAYNRTGAGAAATGSVTVPAKAAFTDNDSFIISDGTHTKTFAYQKTANTHATGNITCPAKAAFVDNDWFILHDGTNDVIFEYNKTGSATAQHAGHLINISAASTDVEVAQATYQAILALHAAPLAMTATDPAATAVIALTNDNHGVGVAATNNVAAVGFSMLGMTGGSVFVESAGNIAAAASIIDISTDSTAITVAARTYTAIAAAHTPLTVTATDPAGAVTIALTNDNPGVLGNVAIDLTGMTATGFTKTGMANGAAFFVESSDNTTASATIINVSTDSTAITVAARTYTALAAAHGVGFTVTATDPAGGTTIALLNDASTVTGNATITKSTDAAFIVTGMSGGVTVLARDDGDIAGPELDSIAADVENIIGSSAGDYIDASSSNLPHVLMGMAGDDTLIGAGQVDYLYGGPGADTLKGGAGDDFLFGGDNSDIVQGGTGNDTINGAGVNCVAAVSAAAPVVPFVSAVCSATFAPASTTVVGIDTLDYSDRTTNNAGVGVYVDLSSLTCQGHATGEVGECDVIVATSGVANVRNIRGGGGDDTLKGDSRDNIIWGGAGADNIYGGLGNDALYGEAGNDHIYGNDGLDATIASTAFDNDYINGGTGTNFEYGDDGLDTIDSSQGSADTVVCGKGDGDIVLPSGNETSVNADCEL
jgi:Ca2+-binding RTX toxin-like protein